MSAPDLICQQIIVHFHTLDTISLEKQKASFSQVLGYYNCVTISPIAIERMQ